MLRIESKATSVESFVQLFSRLCDRESLYVVTRAFADAGTNTRFAVTLASGQAVLQGTGEVAEVHGNKDNRFGHPGMLLRFVELDAPSRAMVARLGSRPMTAPPKADQEPEQDPAASAASLAMISNLSQGSVQSIVECSVRWDERDAPLPTAPGAAEPAEVGPPPRPDATPAPPPAAPATADTMPVPMAAVAAQPGMQPPPVRPVSAPPAVASPVPPAAMPPAAMPPAGPPRHFEATQIVRPLRRPMNRTIVIGSAVAAVLIGAVLILTLGSGDSSSSAAAVSEPDSQTAGAEADAGAAQAAASDTAAADEPAPDCEVEVRSRPRGATVYAQDQELGKTPVTVTLPCDTTELRFERPRYQTATKAVSLAPDSQNRVGIALERPMVTLEIESDPDGAQVVVNGKKRGPSPVTLEVPGYRRTKIVVRKSGYRSYRKRLVPKPPKTTIHAKLRRRR